MFRPSLAVLLMANKLVVIWMFLPFIDFMAIFERSKDFEFYNKIDMSVQYLLDNSGKQLLLLSR